MRPARKAGTLLWVPLLTTLKRENPNTRGPASESACADSARASSSERTSIVFGSPRSIWKRPDRCHSRDKTLLNCCCTRGPAPESAGYFGSEQISGLCSSSENTSIVSGSPRSIWQQARSYLTQCIGLMVVKSQLAHKNVKFLVELVIVKMIFCGEVDFLKPFH